MKTYDFAGYVAAQLGCPQRDAHRYTKAVFAAFVPAFLAGEKSVAVANFGRFSAVCRPVVRKRDPSNGVIREFPARMMVKFAFNPQFARQFADQARPGEVEASVIASNIALSGCE